MKIKLLKFLRENKSFLIFMVLMFIFRSAVADWNSVPSGSMKPTIVEGDRILVNKLAYDIHFPFTHISLHKFADPVRGDIIVFDSAVSDKRLVKRVVGLPGDTVEMRSNVLFINGERISYGEFSSDQTVVDIAEDLLGVEHQVRISANSAMSSFYPVVVPAQHYLVLGDNRDNSADSRVIGFVPRNEIVGRSRSVVMSLNYDNFYIPRMERFFVEL